MRNVNFSNKYKRFLKHENQTAPLIEADLFRKSLQFNEFTDY